MTPRRLGLLLLNLALLGLLLAVHGAVPFCATPTLAQAIWSTGFSQSFANAPGIALYATDFGAPEPAPISFGLIGAWTTAVFLEAGLGPADAYSAMVALWLSLAFGAAHAFARHWGLSSPLASLAAVLWLSMPMIWGHASYSMLGLGIALLPLYLLAWLRFALPGSGTPRFRPRRYLAFLAVCQLAVFMDGYTFVMFAVGSSVIAAWLFVTRPGLRKWIVTRAAPGYLLAFGAAFALFALYIQAPGFPAAPLDAFRGFGMDLTYFVVPTRGVLWIPDLLGLGSARSSREHFGNALVWTTTFAAPLAVFAGWAWWRLRRRHEIATALLVVSLFGFYMALGPSLKIDSRKPAGGSPGPTMPEQSAVAATGSGWISGTLPGFRNMRASYRWLALSVCAGWMLATLLLGSSRGRSRQVAVLAVGLLILVNLPDPATSWAKARLNRDTMRQIEAELSATLRPDIQAGDRVAFLPFGNDFLVNLLASRLEFTTYNIGGDKNLMMAVRHWPQSMKSMTVARLHGDTQDYAEGVVEVLVRGDADAVVLPYFDLLWGAHRWPHPSRHEEKLRHVARLLEGSREVEVRHRHLYSIIELPSAPSEPASLEP